MVISPMGLTDGCRGLRLVGARRGRRGRGAEDERGNDHGRGEDRANPAKAAMYQNVRGM